MKTDLFDFDLPAACIALRPVSPREAAKLLVVRPGKELEDRTVGDLPDLLRAGNVVSGMDVADKLKKAPAGSQSGTVTDPDKMVKVQVAADMK